MNLTMEKTIRGNRELRESFMALAVKIFGLSFRSWYEQGYWTDRYIPYAFADGGKIVANASVNIMDTLWNGRPKRYIQLGTVMTDPAYRGKGLARRLIEEILTDWQNGCDAVYLFANDTVLDFYPRFGFTKASEYQATLPVRPKSAPMKRLDLFKPEDIGLLKRYYEKSNPFSLLPTLGNFGLLMFYCTSSMKDCVYYCEAFDAVVIAEYTSETFLCHDIFCDAGKPLPAVMEAVSAPGAKRAVLGFTPKQGLAECTLREIASEDDALFILKGKDNVFSHNQVRFPALSHA